MICDQLSVTGVDTASSFPLPDRECRLQGSALRIKRGTAARFPFPARHWERYGRL
ncbi:hypothetical protein JW960_10000 [candidate division KSB1 bacterium]|nr:hypothetical protein [candidate division KSB1 bacterium]